MYDYIVLQKFYKTRVKKATSNSDRWHNSLKTNGRGESGAISGLVPDIRARGKSGAPSRFLFRKFPPMVRFRCRVTFDSADWFVGLAAPLGYFTALLRFGRALGRL